MPEIVGIEITKCLPETAVVDSVYKIEGSVKVFDAVGAPPFVYAKIRRKEWYKPEIAEEVSYERGWPVPGTGDFSVEFKPEKEGEYKVSIVATPAPLSLPVAGVFPTLAESDVMEVSVGERPPAVFRFSRVKIDGQEIPLANKDADSGLLLDKKTTDYLEITPSFEWVGPKKDAVISVKAGYKDFLGNFTPKTGDYTQNIVLPESPDVPYSGEVEVIRIPLVGCGDLSDGAVEIVAKIPGVPDYISQIWNVYATKPALVKFRFSDIIIDGNTVELTDHDANSGLLLVKVTAETLEIVPVYQWLGPRTPASISVKAGYRDWAGGFTPKTGAYTSQIVLPESLQEPTEIQAEIIAVPLIACGDLDDGAIEVVAKLPDMPDYISKIWNVYSTKIYAEKWAYIEEYSTGGHIVTSPAPNRIEGSKWYYDYGIVVTLTAIPDAGYKFARWSYLSEVDDHDANPTTMTMDENRGSSLRKIVAEFESVVEYKATISKKELEYNGDRKSIPAGTVSFGKRGLIHVWVRNDTTEAKRLRIYWTVRDPDGDILEEYEDADSQPGGGEHEFIGDRFDMDKPGEYLIAIELKMEGSTEVLDSYSGSLCTVEEEPPTPPKADIQNVDFKATGGTYKIGDRVPFTLSYEYKGKAQSGQLVLSLGTGVYPSFFTVVNYNPMSVALVESMDWVRKSLSSSFVLTSILEPGQKYNTRAKLEALQDYTEETDTDWGVITISEVPVGITFQVRIWGVPDFGSYQKWACYYWDPGISGFVGDGKWINSYDRMTFSNVKSGGYLAVYLKRNSTVSSQYNSPSFSAVDGGSYTYDVQTGRIY